VENFTHSDVIAALGAKGRPLSDYPRAVAELAGVSLPEPPRAATQAEWKAWRDRAWLIDNIDADSKRNEP
jgi:hypothetical protein